MLLILTAPGAWASGELIEVASPVSGRDFVVSLVTQNAKERIETEREARLPGILGQMAT